MIHDEVATGDLLDGVGVKNSEIIYATVYLCEVFTTFTSQVGSQVSASEAY